MIRKLISPALGIAVVGLVAVNGCDKTVAEKSTETTHSDGTKTVDSSKTTQAPDGSTQTKTEHSTNK